MLSLLNKGVDPAAPIADIITLFTAIKQVQSIAADCNSVVDKVTDLLARSNTKMFGLILLRLGIEQNSDVYVKVNWPSVLKDIILASTNSMVKIKACEVYCLILPFIAKESSTNMAELRAFSKHLFPYLLSKIDECDEWTVAALKFTCACLTHIPQAVEKHSDHILNLILRKMTYDVSSNINELVSDCFALLPNLVQPLSPAAYTEAWRKQCSIVLNTLHQLLNIFLNNDPFTNMVGKIEDSGVYVFPDNNNDGKDAQSAYLKIVRQYVNLCKSLAKMLSKQSRFAGSIPVKMIFILITRLCQVSDIRNIKPTTIELQVFTSCFSQMQLATLVVLESLLLNFNVLPYSSVISEMIHAALVSSVLPNITLESISELRLAAWKLLKIFIKKYGCSASGEILKQRDIIFEDLFADISIEERKLSQSPGNQSSQKSKKNAPNTGKRRINENSQKLCKEALETLEQLIYTGSPYFSKHDLQEIFLKVLGTTSLVYSSPHGYPSPYDDEMCRKHLFSVLLALAVTSNLDHRELTQSAVGLLKNAFRDPSIEVTGFCNIAMAVLSTKIHPQRPPPKYRVSSDKQKQVKVSSAMLKCPEWTSEAFVPNIPLENIPKARENMNSRISRTFHDPNESAMLQEEPMEEGGPIEEVIAADAHYSESYASECYISKYAEQAAENHHNGDDILEIHSNQCPDEESDEEDEDEEDERSYGEEEVQSDIPSENVYIPSTSKLQVVNPAQINPETVPQNVTDREYEQLQPCVKGDTSNLESNKNRHLNGVRNLVPDQDVPSSSTQQPLANENGVYMYEDEDSDEDEGDDDEEEEHASFSAEKRVTSFYPSTSASKRQKMDIDESKVEPQMEEGPRSPTLEEMKADFCCAEIDDAKS